MQISNSNITPSPDLYRKVKAAFVLRDDSISGWCRRHNENVSNVRSALCGSWNGPKGKKLRARVIRESGLEDQTHA